MAASSAGPTTYASYFAIEDNDPANGDFSPIDQAHRTEGNPNDETALYVQAVTGDQSYPASFVLLRAGGGSSHYLELLHSVAMFPSQYGRATPWDNKAFATLGDVVEGGHITTVEFPTDAFEIANQGAAHTVPKDLQTALDLYLADTSLDFVGPFADNAANTKQVTARKYFPVPHKYVTLLLGQSTGIRQGFIDTAVVLIQRGDEARYPQLVNWLLLAITRKSAGSASHLVVDTPSPPAMDTDGTYRRVRDQLLKRHLPALQATAPAALAVTNQQLVNELRSIAANQELALNSQIEQRERTAAPRSVEKAFGATTVQELLVLCNVQAVADLPAVWAELAAAEKANRRKTLDSRFRNTAATHRRLSYVPQATPDVKDKVLNLEWGGPNKEDLSLGLQPFSVLKRSYLGNANIGTAGQQQSAMYDMVTDGQSPSLADASALKSTTVVLPNNMMDVKGQLFTVMIVYLTLLGDNHPFVIAYASFLNKLEAFESTITDSFTRYHHPDPILWVFLRFVQIKIHRYWEGARLTGQLASAPDFESVIDEILEERTTWCARMPSKYWSATDRKPKTRSPLFPGTMWQVGGGSVVSGLTADESRSSEESKTNDGSRSSIELNPSTKFAEYKDAMKALTLPVIRADPACGNPPKTKVNGQDMELCAAYHVRGSCFTTCSRKAVHRPLTSSEESELLEWCQQRSVDVNGIRFNKLSATTASTLPAHEARQTNTARSPNSATATFSVHNDELGKLIEKAIDDFLQSPTWESFVKRKRMSSPDISAQVRYLDHPARSYLQHLRNHGVPVPMQPPPWTNEQKDEVIARGCHESAKKETEFVREEFADFMRKQFWTILPYRLVKNRRDLRLSPLGVVPQRDRRPRLIVDLSFFHVNQDCVPIAPAEAMQFGKALQRILQRILLADPKYGPVYIAKIDIADGFYRVALAPRDALKLAVMLPTIGDEEPMVAIPFVLPMGWVNSPPFFSSVTETAADVMNQELNRGKPQPPHRLERLGATKPPTPEVGPAVADPLDIPFDVTPVPKTEVHKPGYKRPVRYADVYVDDFLALFQGSARERLNGTPILLHVLDRVLRPLHPEDHPMRQEPASVKKLKKGDATWSTRKVVLGWILDTVAKTIELPAH